MGDSIRTEALAQQQQHQHNGHDGDASGSPHTGFRSFWKRSSRHESQEGQDAMFVSQDPSGRETTGSKLKRFLTSSSSPSSEGNASQGGGGKQSEAQKRRQQVYQAQKRHRNRKAEYVQSLEAEIEKLRSLDAEVNTEKTALAQQNKAMRDLLASQSLGAHLDSMDLSAPTTSAQASNSISDTGAVVKKRYDEQVEQERWFLDQFGAEEMQWTSSETSAAGSEPPPQAPVAGDSWAALDFILALEHPCREHVLHHAIAPNAMRAPVGEPSGHALTTTAAVFASARPPVGGTQDRSGGSHPLTTVGASSAAQNHSDSKGKAPSQWHLPHSEIDKLVGLSEGLPLDDDEITPAQAYSAIRGMAPTEAFLRPALEALKVPLSKEVHCAQFGSTLATEVFWRHWNGCLETLRFTRPELGG